MRFCLGLVGVVLSVLPLRAQAPGIPVVNAGVARGFTATAMAGFPNDAAGDGTALLAGVSFGARRASVGAFLSRVDIGGDDVNSGGGNVTVKVLGGPLVPVAVNLQAGVAYYSIALGSSSTAGKVKNWHVPVGVGISWTIPRPVVALKPWIAPRLDYTRSDAPSGSLILVDGSETDFGLSGGLSFGFLNGLSVDLAVDRVFTDAAKKPTTFGVGVSFTFK